MDWKTPAAYITGSVDQVLLSRNEYLVAENHILRNQLHGALRLSDGERRTRAEIGKQLGKRALEEVASIVRPETILGWHKKLVARKFDGSKNRTYRHGSGATTNPMNPTNRLQARRVDYPREREAIVGAARCLLG